MKHNVASHGRLGSSYVLEVSLCFQVAVHGSFEMLELLQSRPWMVIATFKMATITISCSDSLVLPFPFGMVDRFFLIGELVRGNCDCVESLFRSKFCASQSSGPTLQSSIGFGHSFEVLPFDAFGTCVRSNNRVCLRIEKDVVKRLKLWQRPYLHTNLG